VPILTPYKLEGPGRVNTANLAEGSPPPLFLRERPVWRQPNRVRGPWIPTFVGMTPTGGTCVVPAQAGTQKKNNWIPAFAGMTYKGAAVSFPHKQESTRCHSRVSRTPGFFAPAPVSFPHKQQSTEKQLDDHFRGKETQQPGLLLPQEGDIGPPSFG